MVCAHSNSRFVAVAEIQLWTKTIDPGCLHAHTSAFLKAGNNVLPSQVKEKALDKPSEEDAEDKKRLKGYEGKCATSFGDDCLCNTPTHAGAD